jgi:hypothetical protein
VPSRARGIITITITIIIRVLSMSLRGAWIMLYTSPERFKRERLDAPARRTGTPSVPSTGGLRFSAIPLSPSNDWLDRS